MPSHGFCDSALKSANSIGTNFSRNSIINLHKLTFPCLSMPPLFSGIDILL
jgi:hypothetical protein